MITHHRHLYADLADPIALLRREGGGGALANFWAYARSSGDAAVVDYSTLMAASQAPVAAQVLDAYDITQHRRLLDIGGGQGVFLAAVRRQAPALELGLFDLPAVVERARTLSNGPIALHGGDFFADALPPGYDCISLIRVLHDHDDAPALALLTRIRAALPPGGRLLIGEPIIIDAEPRIGATYFGLYLLAMGSGRARTPNQIIAMTRQAGFVSARRAHTTLPLVTSVIIANV